MLSMYYLHPFWSGTPSQEDDLIGFISYKKMIVFTTSYNIKSSEIDEMPMPKVYMISIFFIKNLHQVLTKYESFCISRHIKSLCIG